jgi:hypothetical protein
VVFVQGEDGSIRRVSAELGLAGVKESEVLSGLQAGDKVATQVELSGEKIKNQGKSKGSK